MATSSIVAHPHSQLLVSGDILALGGKDSASGIVWTDLVLRLHRGASGEAKLAEASIYIGCVQEGKHCYTHECNSQLSSLRCL